jgi:hypothetical protein
MIESTVSVSTAAVPVARSSEPTSTALRSQSGVSLLCEAGEVPSAVPIQLTARATIRS